MLKHLVQGLLALVCGVHLAQAEPVVLRAAVLEIGTVNWELDTIRHNNLDAANGFALDIVGMAGNPATRVAFQAGEADIVVADWIWVARQRAAGKDYVFVPYSKSVGALMVKTDDPANSLKDLAGSKIGIAGGPVDKSWLILRAFAQQQYGMDLAAGTEQVFGAPPLIFMSALKGEVRAAINFWHFAAKMQAAGMRPLVTVSEAAEHLGLDPEMPLLGYVFNGEMVREHPQVVAGFAAASRAAKQKLASDPSAWDRLRPRMRTKTDAEFEALKAGFIAGIPSPGPINEDAAAKVLQVMASLGGAKLVGAATDLPEGVFVQPLN